MIEKVGLINNLDDLNSKNIIQRVGKQDAKHVFKDVNNINDCNEFVQQHHKNINNKNKTCATHFIYSSESKKCFNVLAPNSDDYKNNLLEYNPDSFNKNVVYSNSECIHSNKTNAKIEVLKNKMIANRGTILKNEKSMMKLAREIAQLKDPSLSKCDLEIKAKNIAANILDKRQFNEKRELERKLKQQAQEIEENNKTLFNIKNEMSTFETIVNALNLNIKDESTKLKTELNKKNKQVDIVQNISKMNDTMESLLINSLYAIIVIVVILTIYLVSKYFI